MNLISAIKQNSKFTLRNGVYCLDEDFNETGFEEIYIELRKKENRLYDDETVRNLPDVPKNHPHCKEWRIRKNSSAKFLNYLNIIPKEKNVLELGCGNGWLTNMISRVKSTNVIGIDINSYELQQATRVFGTKYNPLFLRANIFNEALNGFKFNFIVLAGAVQYFEDLTGLVNRLLELLDTGGEIHIFDSPLYQEQELQKARQDKLNYFTQIGCPKMAEYFYNHNFGDLRKFICNILYNPTNPFNRIKRTLGVENLSPFYWVNISK